MALLETPTTIAGIAGLGTLAMATVPAGFEDWRVTAMLAFLVVSCLGIIVYQTHANSKSAIKLAEALTKVTERQHTQQGQVDAMIQELRTNTQATTRLYDRLGDRPCLNG